jgi:phosphatidyl-myo-inositol dimannoside synthase
VQRIIHLWAPRFSGFGGGIAAFSRELVLALRQDGHDVKLYGKDDRSTAFFAASAIGGAGAGRPDVVISTHINFGPAARLAKGLFHVPYVLVAHGIDVHPQLSMQRRNGMISANAVWAVSSWTKQRVVDLGADNVRVIGNTVDDERFTTGRTSAGFRARYRLGESEKVILTVSRLDADEAYKGHDSIIRALPLLRSAAGMVRYLIAGTGEDRSRIEHLAASCGVSEMVTFCGFVPDHELPDHYRLADVYAMPSTGEGFGIVFLEAMACGTPVLGGNADGTVDALAGGELGELVDPLSDEAVAHGLLRLLRREGRAWWYVKPELRARMLAVHGRHAFRDRIREALASVT